MSGAPFFVLNGNPESKEILIETLHEKGNKQTGLAEFLKDLSETEDKSGDWWIALDEDENPRGALTVRFLEGENMSYLRSIWTRVLRTEDQYMASKVLLDAWMNEVDERIKKYQADLPLYSPLIDTIEQAGFQKEKMLMASYNLETRWEASELPEDYRMRPVTKDELPSIYLDLVAPDLDPASPIYVSEEGFLMFTKRVPSSALESWVVVENEKGKSVGFAASFLNRSPKNKDKDPSEINQAVMFGPHATEASVQLAIIQEMLVYWKTKGIESLRILRVDELYPSTIKALDAELVNSTIRFIRDNIQS